MLENIKVGNKYKGKINNCEIEIIDISKGYVTYKDLKTLKKWELNIQTFIRLQLEEA